MIYMLVSCQLIVFEFLFARKSLELNPFYKIQNYRKSFYENLIVKLHFAFFQQKNSFRQIQD